MSEREPRSVVLDTVLLLGGLTILVIVVLTGGGRVTKTVGAASLVGLIIAVAATAKLGRRRK